MRWEYGVVQMINKIIAVIVVISAFTLLDYLGHQYLEKNSGLDVVPQQYYTNKIFYGSIILLVGILFIDKFANLSVYPKTFLLTSIVVLLLQARYYSAYSQKFNQYVLILHYAALAPLIYFAQERRLL